MLIQTGQHNASDLLSYVYFYDLILEEQPIVSPSSYMVEDFIGQRLVYERLYCSLHGDAVSIIMFSLY